MRKAFALCLFAVLATLDVTAKEDCWGNSWLEITRANGDLETPNIYNTPTIALCLGDSALLRFGIMSGEGCFQPRYYVRKNGELVMGIPAGFMDFDVSAPGLYADSASGLPFFGNTGTFIVINTASSPLQLNVKAWLQAAYDENTGLMRDDLRTAGLITAFNYQVPTSSTVLNVTGPDAVVDRAFVELRTATLSQLIYTVQYGLIQRDGDIVAGDGLSPLIFYAPPGDYYISVGQRNHLRAMTAVPITLDSLPMMVDFRDPGFPTYGTDARKIQGNAALLWAGKVSGNSISYTGSLNDRDVILQVVGSLPNNSVIQYSKADLNMDGMVKYTGSNNDRDALLLYLGGSVPTFVRQEQVP